MNVIDALLPHGFFLPEKAEQQHWILGQRVLLTGHFPSLVEGTVSTGGDWDTWIEIRPKTLIEVQILLPGSGIVMGKERVLWIHVDTPMSYEVRKTGIFHLTLKTESGQEFTFELMRKMHGFQMNSFLTSLSGTL